MINGKRAYWGYNGQALEQEDAEAAADNPMLWKGVVWR